MTVVTCTACHQPVARHEAVQRGDLRIVRSWHRDCFTVARAVAGVDADAVTEAAMPLTARMALVQADERLKA